MKLMIRIFALTVVAAGLAAASTASHPVQALGSSLSATSSLPIPSCGPGMCGQRTK